MIKKFIKSVLSYLLEKLTSQNIINGKLSIGKDSQVYGSRINGKLECANNCIIKEANISGYVLIGRNSSLWGPNINLNGTIKIGSFCSIASNVSMYEYNHNSKRLSTYYLSKHIFKEKVPETVSKGRIEVGSDVWIGHGSTILTGVKIGHGAIIAANSLVNTDVPPYEIYGGVPAIKIKDRFSQTLIKKLLIIEWWNWSEEKLRLHKWLFTEELTEELLNNYVKSEITPY